MAPSSDGGEPISDYVVQRSADAGQTWRTVCDRVSTRQTATVKGLTNGHLYDFRVAAVNNAGRGPWSSPASAVPRPWVWSAVVRITPYQWYRTSEVANTGTEASPIRTRHVHVPVRAMIDSFLSCYWWGIDSPG